MAPKAKAKVAAKAKVRAKAKAKGAPNPGRPGRGGRRRPASAGPALPERSMEEKWANGQEVEACRIPVGELGEGVQIAMEAASYYQQECRVSGQIQGVEVREGQVSLRLTLLGTTHDGLLKLHTGAPGTIFKLHLCHPGCNQQAVSDTTLHTRKLRRLKALDGEEGWVSNLEKVRPLEERDPLELLRQRERELGLDAPPGIGGQPPPGRESKKEKKKKKKEKGDDKKKTREEKDQRGQEEASSGSQGSVRLDGSQARLAAKKSPATLFGGTGLDPREKTRRKVSRKARLALKKKGKKDASSKSSGSSSSTDPSLAEEGAESIFQQSSKLRQVALGYPGALACQALAQMRGNLLAEIGSEDRPGRLPACAVAYYRQQLARKASGPAQRECLTIAASVDQLLAGNPAAAMDILLQRLKSCESSMMGSHWTVSQRLEVVPQENTQLTPAPEMGVARKDVYDESRLRWLAAQPEGRAGQSGNKGGSKGKSDTKDKDGSKGGKDRRWGKGGSPKGDAAKKEGGSGKQDVEECTGVRTPDQTTARAMTLGRAMSGGPSLTEDGYKGGTAMASHQEKPTWASAAAGCGVERLSGSQEQSLHVAAPKRECWNSLTTCPASSTGQGAADGPALETTADAFVSAHRKKDAEFSVTGRTLGSCGSFLAARLLEVLPLRSQTTGRGNSDAFFPLPTSRAAFLQMDPTLTDVMLSWLFCVTVSLNSSWGMELINEGLANVPQKKCLDGILKEVHRFCEMEARMDELNCGDFFKIRSIDYKGDEVKVARKFGWKNILPALPREIGKVPLADVCTLGSQHYVLNFDLYLKPSSEWEIVKPPRVMVDDLEWGTVCTGLVQSGICTFIEEHEVFHVHDVPLLNGLFGVSKEEWTPDGTEIFRLIMNLVPLNALCMPMTGDVNTLPSWSGMSPYFLQPSQCLLVSSEDVKCFFYTMSVPKAWVKYLAFNKLVPSSVLPPSLQGRRVYVASQVLPMGFLNSVSLAQHVHRNLALQVLEPRQDRECNAPEHELRKDRPFPAGDSLWRIYLDNYDLLEKVEATQMVDLEGTQAPGVLALRQEYELWDVPRNVKKAVQRSSICEVQGATVNGLLGVAYPRESKLCKYFSMALDLCNQKGATQKQWQVVCGGLVYVAMFRRALLGGLNAVWRHIESYGDSRSGFKVTPAECRLEVLRFLGCLPLARMDFRLDMHEVVTCSDASTSGGGVCASTSVTPFGLMVSQGSLRGELAESRSDHMVLSVGLFDGIGALRVALDALGAQVIGHVSVEKEASARRVVEAHYPGVVSLEHVEDVVDDTVKEWSTRFSQASLVVLGAGPPCQGVSGLNADRRGALRDSRSCLFSHVPRIRSLLKKHFKWCPVFTLMESVASMDPNDRDIMSEAIGTRPLSCNAGTFTWCHRPRLYWVDWDVDEQYVQDNSPAGAWSPVEIQLNGFQDITQVTRRGWLKVDPSQAFPTFTTSRPQARPGRKPAGIHTCTQQDLDRWISDLHRFPPYQYRQQHCLVNRQNHLRVPDVAERELMLGFPLHYTAACLPKGARKGAEYLDTRLYLLGNTWSVPVVAWLLGQLLGSLGLRETPTPQEILDSLAPGTEASIQGRLVRLPLNPDKGGTNESSYDLAIKLGNLISMKGEDILLTTPTSQLVRHHRLRASVPSALWRWKVVTGWQWKLGGEHINSLELRAILTSLRWRLEHKGHFGIRFIHLTDSLVCLHCLTRGRSSSRKLRRTLARINALLLASNSQPVWGYVHTDQNPADKPSRWGRRVRTKFRNAA